ncbi:MAG: gliding motility-associated C-terminal domain-containing protein, partial [Bacteroidales bacterium]|nr:gliding motility-associated C-terminal domain-containing protein [Bacteroidales bacterium]
GFSEGVYTITITDSHQCNKEITGITLIDLPVECIWIPNAFTPNGDGLNDLWIIENLEIYYGAVLNIYNRWGQLIHTGGYTDKWNGKCNDRFVASGTYLYILDLKNGEKPFVGNLSVIY